MLVDRPSDAVRIVLITSGTGASTSFAIAEEVIADLYGYEGEDMKYVKAVIFDWAGTVVDHGSLAPMGAFVETFAEFGVDDLDRRGARADGHGQTPAYRRPDGVAAHRRRLGRTPRPGADARPTSTRVYAAFVPKNIAVAARYANLIPGVAEVAAELRREGSRSARRRVTRARSWPRSCRSPPPRVLRPTASSAPATRPTGGPTPFMLYKSFLELQVWPASSAIKVDDTEVGIAEGVNAGAWAVGVAVSGNVFGLSEADAAALAARRFPTQARRGGEKARSGWRALCHRQRRRTHARGARDRSAPRKRRTAVTEPIPSPSEGDVNVSPLRAAWRARLSAETRDLLDRG